MHWIDWIITICPIAFVIGISFYSRKYVRGVVDYLAAGRVAGRYVICVGDMAAGLSVISMVAFVEAKYRAGFSLYFWGMMTGPVGIIMALTGFCVYRFRETKSLSIGQFLEMRYNRAFRVFAASIRSIADICTNAVGPAIAANFFIYFIGLPNEISLIGISIPTYAIIVAMVLTLAMLVIWPGGRVSLLVTDCIQGLMCYPIFVLIVIFILCNFSWRNEIAPVLMDRMPDESFLNPFDIEKLRDFNLFAIVVMVIGQILNRGSWIGNDTSGTGRTPHEQKMAGILGAWRNGFAMIMYILIACVIITVMSHEHFANKARNIRVELSDRVAAEVVSDIDVRQKLSSSMEAIPDQYHKIGIDKPLSQDENLDTPYIEAASNVLKKDSNGNYLFQKFRTLYGQMMMPVSLRNILPVGMMGIFCLLMIMLMLSTDDSRIMNCSSTIFQDVIMPLIKKPLTPKQHLLCLRLTSLTVAMFFFLFALFFSQLDYILMFLTILAAIWLGGAGPVMIFGLYSRFGNTVGAFSALFVGSGISIGGLLLQRNWASRVYPFLERMGWTDNFASFLSNVSAPFSPYIEWKMDAVKFPINSYEIYLIAMVWGVTSYVIGSLLTYRGPYDLERLLHRGKYCTDGENKIKSTWTLRNLFNKLIGITPEYTRGDKIISWAVFSYSIVFNVVICFIGVLIWNIISPWPLKWWSYYFFVTCLLIAGVVGIISTIWFMIGGIVDTKRLFKDLAERVDNPDDDGRVEGHISIVDATALTKDAKDGKTE